MYKKLIIFFQRGTKYFIMEITQIIRQRHKWIITLCNHFLAKHRD